ncbi:MAG: hypothetical protein CMC55_07245 [Flavobacteriaceae bacterium]|uniref:hypothetical protein n=1 Tax=Bizionia echini TaxID=649333 RepID=UPI000C9189F0|nr:hypothetical protein [Flavobacteriaceae bacterium]
MKKFIIPFLFATFISFGQKNLEKKVNSLIASDNFQTLRIENFFIHTNKSIYFSGESIWFKAYVTNSDTNFPSLETTNLYINLYGPNRSLISSELFFVENGMANGRIELAKTLESGTYYLQLDTEWNRNFKSGTIFNVIIENLNPPEEDTKFNTQENTNNSVTDLEIKKGDEELIKFFPESQTLLEGIQNMIIFSTKKNIKGLVIDDNTGKPVASLKSNNQGIGAFKILQNSTYSAVLNVDNKEIRVRLPHASEKGFIIHKISGDYNSESVDFQIITNNKTLEEYDDSYVFAVLHREGSIKSVAPIEISKGTKEYKISFYKENVFNGLNTITLFNEMNEPISERHFYWKTDSTANIQITKSKKENDSLSLNLLLTNKSVPVNISVSVLPKNTKVYLQKYSIISSLLLLPYIDNHNSMVNPNILTNNELDFYLQANTTKNPFPYKDINNANLAFKNENGITLKGSINTKIDDLSGYKIMLTSKENNLLLVQPLDNKKTFEFNELMLMHPSKYQLSLLDKKGEIIKGTFYVFNSYTSYQANPNLIMPFNLKKEMAKIEAENSKLENFDLSSTEYNDFEELDEVVIKADRVKEDQETKRKLRKLGVQGVGFSRLLEPSKSPYAKGDILQYFNTIPGVTVKYNQDNTPFLNNERFLKTLNNLGDAPFNIILDGTPIGTDLTIINFRQASEFEYIIVNYRGAGFGALYPKGVISLVTLKGTNGEKIAPANPDIQINDTQFGFNFSNEPYEKLVLTFPNYSSKENFETLDWIPNFQVEPNRYNPLKINVEDANGIKLIINGLSATGDLIYEVINID